MVKVSFRVANGKDVNKNLGGLGGNVIYDASFMHALAVTRTEDGLAMPKTSFESPSRCSWRSQPWLFASGSQLN